MNRAMVSNINVPYQKAIQVQQTVTVNSTVIRAQELIGSIIIIPDSGSIFSYPINPIDPTYSGTRLQQLAGSFQKYRFRKLHFRVMTNLPTTVGGTITTGYAENPEQSISSTYEDAQREIFALDGANISNLWVHNIVRCNIRDKKKWYNIDPDSTEAMQTTQGIVYLLPSGDINITNPVYVPVVLDYEIEFTGAAKQNIIDNSKNFYLGNPYLMNFTASTVTGFTGPEFFWVSQNRVTGSPDAQSIYIKNFDKYLTSSVPHSGLFDVSPNVTITNSESSDSNNVAVKCQIVADGTNGDGSKYLVIRYYNNNDLPITRTALPDPQFDSWQSPATTWIYTGQSTALNKRTLNLVRAQY